MMSLNTAFQKVYGEALEPYGFKKVKGKHPYYARVIGEEIVHVITCAPQPANFGREDIEKGYMVFGGIATVYRPRINFDDKPWDNSNWYIQDLSVNINLEIADDLPEYIRNSPIFEAYLKLRENKCPRDRFQELFVFSYTKNDEASLLVSLKNALKETKQYMLPLFETIKDLRTCLDYFLYFRGDLFVIDEYDFGNNHKGYEYNEGFLNYIFYTTEEYKNMKIRGHENGNRRRLEEMAAGKTKMTMESFEKDRKFREELMNEQIATFTKYMEEKEEHIKLMKEMERRKEKNKELLRGYGFDI
ncbi:MAG: hypothetical protein NC225_00010 [Clostridium sp.]|nr:hypothetical protein [Clostridium sp.]MCM1459084.1 hypothetical protein [Bacteroides sp.]